MVKDCEKVGDTMKTIYMMPNPEKDCGLEFTKRVAELSAGKARLLMNEAFAETSIAGVEYCSQKTALVEADTVFALGGDGTLLNAAHDVLLSGQSILGFNLGRLGFLAEVEPKEVEDCLHRFFVQDYVTESRMMLRSCLTDLQTGREQYFDSLNDVVVSRGSASRLLDLNVYIDDEFVDDYKADGMIVATPTGSTAYSMSAGGPIVDPSLDSMLITPICPHKLYSRAVLVPAQKTITASMGQGRIEGAQVSADGREETAFTENSRFTITKSPYQTKLIRVNGSRFYSVLRHKLIGKEN